MTEQSRFPSYFSHRNVCCYACGAKLIDLSNSGHAPGSGAFRGKCPACFQHTWYDCAEGTVEMIDENERAAGRGKTSPKTT